MEVFSQEIEELKSKAAQSFSELIHKKYDKAIVSASISINWYAKEGKKKRMTSRFFRGSAIVFFGLGLLCPLLDATNVENSLKFAANAAGWGYVFIALAGIILLYDRLFGTSSSWIRFVLAELELKKNVIAFTQQWSIDTLNINYSTISNAQQVELLTKIKVFNELVFDTVKKETDTWATEFKNNMTELESLIRAKSEKLKEEADTRKIEYEKETLEASNKKNGYVKVVIDNTSKAQDIEVTFNNYKSVLLTTGENEVLFSDIIPGTYQLNIRGKKGADLIIKRDFVSIKPAEVTKVEITL